MAKQSPVRIPIRKKSSLSNYGYHVTLTATERRHAISRALKASREGNLAMYRRLVALSVLHKNRNPLYSKRFRSDANWIKKNYDI